MFEIFKGWRLTRQPIVDKPPPKNESAVATFFFERRTWILSLAGRLVLSFPR
jgi:hypothetical protein